MTSIGADQRAYQMVMRKGDPSYSVSPKRTLFGDRGTEVRIAPLLNGIVPCRERRSKFFLRLDAPRHEQRVATRRHLVTQWEEMRCVRQSVAVITPSQCRAARGLLGWSQQDLATQAGVGIVTVHQLEAGGPGLRLRKLGREKLRK